MIELSFAQAKAVILGDPPKNDKARIGYNVAKGYFEPLIEDAEKIRYDLAVPKTGFATYLRNGFEFSSYDGFRHFDEEAYEQIHLCTERFRKHYEPLLNMLEPRAA